MHQRKGRAAWSKGFLGQTSHNARVLTDAVEHNRIFKFGSYFADDVDTFRFELLEVAQIILFHIIVGFCFMLLYR